MPNKNRWDVIYANCFENQPEGHALYKKVSITQLEPGTCGYFDQQGDWQQIVDLTKPDELKEKGYSFVPGIKVTEDPPGEGWPLRKSESIYRFDTTISAKAE
jgi:hypothetical protein